MGGAASLRQVSTLPLDRDDGISRERFEQIVSISDVYLTYEWGIDRLGRSVPKRAQAVGEYLESKGFFVQSADGFCRVLNTSIGTLTPKERLCINIKNSQCLLVFITQRYLQRLGDINYILSTDTDKFSPNLNDQQVEFMEFTRVHGLRNLILCLMEPDLQSTLPEILSKRICIDLSSANFGSDKRVKAAKSHFLDISPDLSSTLQLLYDLIIRAITPLRKGGPFKQIDAEVALTREAKHYKWLHDHLLPGTSHETLTRYAKILTDQNLLFATQVLLTSIHDSRFLENIGFSSDDSKRIHAAAIQDVKDNFDYYATNKIDAIMEIKGKELAEEELLKLKRITEEVASSNRMKEISQMRVEDLLSYSIRESYNREYSEQDGKRRQLQLLKTMDAENELYMKTRLEIKNALEERLFFTESEARKKKLESVVFISHTDELLDRLRGVLASLDKESQSTAASISASIASRVKSKSFSHFHSDAKIGGREMSHPVGSLVPYGVVQQLAVRPSPSTVPADTFLLLIVEGSLILRQIEKECIIGGPSKVTEFLQQGAGKAVLLFLAMTFIHRIEFSSSSNISTFLESLNIAHRSLLLPEQCLLTLTTLCKCRADAFSINQQFLHLLGRAGAVELALDVTKAHLEDIAVCGCSLRFLDVLVSSREPSIRRPLLDRLIRDPMSPLLIMLLLERYAMESKEIAVYGSSLMCRLLAEKAFDHVLKPAQPQLIVPVIDRLVSNYTKYPLGEELLIAYAGIIQELRRMTIKIWLPSREIIGEVGKGEEIGKTAFVVDCISSTINEVEIVRFLVNMLCQHGEFQSRDSVCTQIMRSLRAVMAGRDDMRRCASQFGIVSPLMEILREFMNQSMPAGPYRQIAFDAVEESLLCLATSLPVVEVASNFWSASNAARDQLVNKGIVEMLMEIFTYHIHTDRMLQFAWLSLSARLVHGGHPSACIRFVALGLCEKIGLFLDLNHAMDLPLFELTSQFIFGICLSDPIKVRGRERLLKSARPDTWLMSHMRLLCTARTSGGHWSHLYTASVINNDGTSHPKCISCLLCCDLACLLCRDDAEGGGNKVTERFGALGLPKFLLPAPRLFNSEAFPVDDVSRITSAVSASLADSFLLTVRPATSEELLYLHNSGCCVEGLGNVCGGYFDATVKELFSLFNVAYGTSGECFI